MRGLVIKDIICLKKNFKMFFFVTFGIIVLSVMYVISIKCGNMKDILAQWGNEDAVSRDAFVRMSKIAIALILTIPMGFIANVTDCFKEDKKAEFKNTLLSLPVNKMEIVGARYSSMFAYVIMGTVCSVIAALCVSSATDDYKFSDLLSVVMMIGGIMIIYMSIVMPFLYLLGSKRADIICSVPFFAAFFSLGIILGKKFIDIPEHEFYTKLFDMIDEFTDFLMSKGFIFMAIAVVFVICSYFISVKIIKSNRGINL